MVIHGQIRNGVIVLNDSTTLPEGATVRVEIVSTPGDDSTKPTHRRQGGIWKGKVAIAPDFDELPDDIAEAFGATKP